MAIGRSENMRRIRSRDTVPELKVRRALREMGYTGYRLHRKDIAGTPDIVFIGRRKAIFVHGCFWHGHTCTEGSRVPKSNQEYWVPKIERNRERDAQHQARLVEEGWAVLVVWECEIRDGEALSKSLSAFLAR